MSKSSTPHFGWKVPDGNEMIRDGAAAISDLGRAIDASLGAIDARAPSGVAYALKSDVDKLATKAENNNLNRAASGALMATGRPILVGTAVITIQAWGTGRVDFPPGSFPVQIDSVVCCNGDQSTAQAVTYVNSMDKNGFNVTMIRCGPTGTGTGVPQGTSVRINYVAVGL